LVGLIGGGKAVLRLGIVRVLVRMIFLGELPIGRLYVLCRGGLGNAQHLIGIAHVFLYAGKNVVALYMRSNRNKFQCRSATLSAFVEPFHPPPAARGAAGFALVERDAANALAGGGEAATQDAVGIGFDDGGDGSLRA